jgi:hypothetical protein
MIADAWRALRQGEPMQPTLPDQKKTSLTLLQDGAGVDTVQDVCFPGFREHVVEDLGRVGNSQVKSPILSAPR